MLWYYLIPWGSQDPDHVENYITDQNQGRSLRIRRRDLYLFAGISCVVRYGNPKFLLGHFLWFPIFYRYLEASCLVL